MITLGVYAVDRGAAAAVADRGRVLSAVVALQEQRDRAGDGIPLACVDTALRAANISPADVDRIVTVGAPCHDSAAAIGTGSIAHRYRTLAATLSRKESMGVDPLLAQAAQVRTVAPGNTVVVVLEGQRDGGGAIVQIKGRNTTRLKSLAGTADLLRIAARMADALGEDAEQPFLALERLTGQRSQTIEARLATCLSCRPDLTFCVDVDGVDRLIADQQASCPAPLDAADTVHIAVQRARGALAAAMLERSAEMIADLARQAKAEAGATDVAFTGSAFASPTLRARVRQRVEGALFAPVAEPIGAALGAAILCHDDVAPLTHLALGPSFGEDDVKAALENCRLDSVYEPDWSKLYARTSELLGTGALIAWFQGPLEFGPRSLGSRSLLCDPSSRYARENVNVFLLHRDVHAALPLSVAESAWDRSARSSDSFCFETVNAQQMPEWRDKVTAAVNSRGDCLLHVTSHAISPHLTRLLETHRARTGVPGLINVPMTTAGSLTVTPRESIQTAFGSAVDALVIGRFLVSKDYWLLRSRQA